MIATADLPEGTVIAPAKMTQHEWDDYATPLLLDYAYRLGLAELETHRNFCYPEAAKAMGIADPPNLNWPGLLVGKLHNIEHLLLPVGATKSPRRKTRRSLLTTWKASPKLMAWGAAQDAKRRAAAA